MELSSVYNLWTHDTCNKDWSIKTYTKILSFATAQDFWKVLNNFDKLFWQSNNIFIMRNNIEPTWETIDNRNGGTCAIKIPDSHALAAFEDIITRIVVDDDNIIKNNDITGLSISPKSSFFVIKIWNGDKKYDLSKTLDLNYLKKYGDLEIIYKQNEPEY